MSYFQLLTVDIEYTTSHVFYNVIIYVWFFIQSVDDVDTENLQDTAQCALYAPFIFRYYKEREVSTFRDPFVEIYTHVS